MLFAPLLFLLPAQPLPAREKAAPQKAVEPKPQKKQDAAASDPNFGDEQFLKNAHLDVTGPALMTFFRQRITSAVEPARLATLTQQLSDKNESVSTKAASELVGLGPLALPSLRRAANHASDEETVRRARKCLEGIEGRSGANVVQSAVRLLAARNPEGAAEVLLNYLPLADDDGVAQEIETALRTVGLREGHPVSVLLHALNDPVPIRRGIAARVLCRIGGSAGRSAVRPLLKDEKPSVRMEAALSLAEVYDAGAVPVLIELVADLPPEGRKRVDSYLAELAGDWAVKGPQGSDAVSGRLRRELWSAWWRTLDGNQLLAEFRNRTLREDERTRVLERIAKLADASAEVRSKAAQDLLNMGPSIAPLLRQTINQGNQRVAEPVRQCLESLERDEAKPLPDSALRLLALRRPPGSLAALLAYVPFAENETQSEQLIDLLAVLGCNEGKADPLLLRALDDKLSVRRAAAAVALCKGKAEDEMPAVRKLLRDADAVVRLRTARALLQRGDKQAVPALIALLTDLPLDDVWEAEETLIELAGDNGPNERIDDKKASRTASVKAWTAWWSKEGKNIDLAQLSDRARENARLLAIDSQRGRILEITRHGQVRWKMDGLQWPQDALICPNGNILVVNVSGSSLSMRSRDGKEIWQKGCNNAFLCQRLRNGNFFIGCHQGLMEIDPNGKEVSSRMMQELGWIVGARKFPNGHIGLFTNQGQYLRLDAAGKQVATYTVDMKGAVATSADVLPGERVIASLHLGRVVEYGDKGKQIWEANIGNPGFPHRLPNGHTLVTDNGTPHLFELDRSGKVVSEKKDLEYAPWRIRRR